MKMTLLALVAASAASLTQAAATPVDGAAIARIGHQVDPAISVATKKKKTSQTKSAAKTCPEGQELGARTGKCRPPTSEEK